MLKFHLWCIFPGLSFKIQHKIQDAQVCWIIKGWLLIKIINVANLFDSLYPDLYPAVGEVSTGRFWLLPPGLLWESAYASYRWVKSIHNKCSFSTRQEKTGSVCESLFTHKMCLAIHSRCPVSPFQELVFRLILNILYFVALISGFRAQQVFFL